jgi:hypothetical protein
VSTAGAVSEGSEGIGTGLAATPSPAPLSQLVGEDSDPQALARWETLFTRDGVTVWQRSVEGSGLVEFRAQKAMDASIHAVLAAVLDTPEAPAWLKNCEESRRLAVISPGHGITYNRTASPVFFISDRDVVLEGRTRVLPGSRSVRLDFEGVSHPDAPPRDGVVRVRALHGHWLMIQLDPAHTLVSYQVHADPGGYLPTWIVYWASRGLPYHTLIALERQAQKEQYRDGPLSLREALAWARAIP